MVNSNYNKGRRKEYAICHELKKQGYDIAQRSAGSHSPIDVFAINKQERKIRLVQSKPSSMSNKKKDELENSLSWLNGTYEVEFEVV